MHCFNMNIPYMDPAMQSATRQDEGRAQYRSVFISDTHLGTRGCRSDFLADFLRRTSCDHLFLVGDIIDGWRLRKSWYWDETHDEVLRLILRKARAGTAVTYIPGNHDEMFRAWLPMGLEIAGIRLRQEAFHTTAAGKRLLVIHGDEFDSVVRYAKFLALLGDGAYTRALVLNRFETALANEAKQRGFDGVVCGHIHHAEMRQVNGVLYINDGDWVESCTALVEHHDGRLELIDWAALNRLSFMAPRGALTSAA